MKSLPTEGAYRWPQSVATRHGGSLRASLTGRSIHMLLGAHRCRRLLERLPIAMAPGPQQHKRGACSGWARNQNGCTTAQRARERGAPYWLRPQFGEFREWGLGTAARAARARRPCSQLTALAGIGKVLVVALVEGGQTTIIAFKMEMMEGQPNKAATDYDNGWPMLPEVPERARAEASLRWNHHR